MILCAESGAGRYSGASKKDNSRTHTNTKRPATSRRGDGGRRFSKTERSQLKSASGGVVRNYLTVIFDKIGVNHRVELALWYEARGHESQTKKMGSLRSLK
jgi:hypothetical protein